VTTAGLGLDDSASRNLAFVRCEGGEDFFLLASRHFDEVQRTAEFRSDLVKFLWRDTEIPMRLLETDRSFSRLGRRVWERPAGDGTNPKRSHELEARQQNKRRGPPTIIQPGSFTSIRPPSVRSMDQAARQLSVLVFAIAQTRGGASVTMPCFAPTVGRLQTDYTDPL
jgi:hypothetical protein